MYGNAATQGQADVFTEKKRGFNRPDNWVTFWVTFTNLTNSFVVFQSYLCIIEKYNGISGKHQIDFHV